MKYLLTFVVAITALCVISHAQPAAAPSTPAALVAAQPAQGATAATGAVSQADPLQAAAQTALQAALAAGKQSLLSSYLGGALPLSGGLIAQLLAIQAAFLSLGGLIQKLLQSQAGGQPAPAAQAVPTNPTKWQKISGWLLLAVKTVIGNL